MITKAQKKKLLIIKDDLENIQGALYELGDKIKRESLIEASFNIDEILNILSSVLP
jgi:hypothetical protein